MIKTFLVLLFIYTLPAAVLGFFLIDGEGFVFFLLFLILLSLPFALHVAREKPWRLFLNLKENP